MALEIISEPTGAPTGSFTPHADQKQFRSAFGIISGDGKSAGFHSGHSLQNGLPTSDGRRKLVFKEFKDAKAGFHDVKINGVTLREFVCPAEDATEKDRYDGQLSTDRMAGYLAPYSQSASGSQVGLQKGGENQQVQVPQTHQF